MQECKSWMRAGHCISPGLLMIGDKNARCLGFKPNHEYQRDEFHKRHGKTRCGCGFELVKVNKGWICNNPNCQVVEIYDSEFNKKCE